MFTGLGAGLGLPSSPGRLRAVASCGLRSHPPCIPSPLGVPQSSEDEDGDCLFFLFLWFRSTAEIEENTQPIGISHPIAQKFIGAKTCVRRMPMALPFSSRYSQAQGAESASQSVVESQ